MTHTVGTQYRIAGFSDDAVFSLVETAKNTFALSRVSEPGSLAAKPIVWQRKPYDKKVVISDDMIRVMAGNKDWSLYAKSTLLQEDRSVLEEAQELIFGDRAKSYGSADANFRRIATGWGVILGTTITPEQVGLCMTWLKIARQVGKPNRDNLVDAAGYLGCVEKVQKGE